MSRRRRRDNPRGTGRGALGDRVSVPPSAAVALERLSGGHFDAASTDPEMPGAFGATLAHAVRDQETAARTGRRWRSAAVIDGGDDTAVHGAGFDASWAKPIDVQSLAYALRRLIDAARDQFDRNSPNVFNPGT